jgi:hypothetical protein
MQSKLLKYFIQLLHPPVFRSLVKDVSDNIATFTSCTIIPTYLLNSCEKILCSWHRCYNRSTSGRDEEVVWKMLNFGHQLKDLECAGRDFGW